MDRNQIIAEHFVRTKTKDAAQMVERLEDRDLAAFIGELPEDLALQLLKKMNNYKAAKSLELIDSKKVTRLIEQLDLLSVELLLRPLSEESREQILLEISKEKGDKIRRKLSYAADAIGAYMRTDFFSIQSDMQVGETIELMKKEKDLIGSEIFVIDGNLRITGIVMVADLIISKDSDRISGLAKSVISFFAEGPIQPLATDPSWALYRSLPVIDFSKVLIGVLYYKDVIKLNLAQDQGKIREVRETASALGELYRIGLTGLLQSTGRSE